MKNEFIKQFRIKDWIFHIFVLILASSFVNFTNFHYKFFISIFILWYAYSLNYYFDENGKIKYFLIPLIISIIINLLFYINEIFILSTIFLILATFYSLKPIYLKSTICSTFIDIFGHSIIFLIGASNVYNIKIISNYILIVIFLVISRILHELSHYNKDKRNKIKNLTILIGSKNSIKILYFILILLLPLTSFTFYSFSYISIRLFITFIIFSILMSLIIKRSNIINENVRSKFRILSIIIGLIWIISK